MRVLHLHIDCCNSLTDSSGCRLCCGCESSEWRPDHLDAVSIDEGAALSVPSSDRNARALSQYSAFTITLVLRFIRKQLGLGEGHKHLHDNIALSDDGDRKAGDSSSSSSCSASSANGGTASSESKEDAEMTDADSSNGTSKKGGKGKAKSKAAKAAASNGADSDAEPVKVTGKRKSADDAPAKETTAPAAATSANGKPKRRRV